MDAVALTRALLRVPSVTSDAEAVAAALDVLQGPLEAAGFWCARVDRGGVPNLFARWGPKGHPRTLGFGGHVDVVPVGDRAAWTHDPWGAVEEEGWLHGRGATDMKSGVAAWAVAAMEAAAGAPDGALILLITGDEEGPSTDGTRALLDWMEREGERMTDCVVGEPTSPEVMGDAIKIGRRGSATAYLDVEGVQGHAAYPERARNPVHATVDFLGRLTAEPLDAGTEHFGPSTLQVVTVDVGNPADNVVPARARATVNARFNDQWTSARLMEWMRGHADAVAAATGCTVRIAERISGESFLTPPGPLSELVADAVAAETNRRPVLSTSGGTSDARFVKDHCPVVECGLVGHRMHAVDERVRVEWIEGLERIYRRVIAGYFR